MRYSIMPYPANGATTQLGTESAGSATGIAYLTNDLDYTLYFRDEFLWSTDAPTFSTAFAADIASYNPIASYLQVHGGSTTRLPDTVLTSLVPPNLFPFSTGWFGIGALYDTNLGPVSAGASAFALAAMGALLAIGRRYSGNS